jgi:3-dehydroquinate synthase
MKLNIELKRDGHAKYELIFGRGSFSNFLKDLKQSSSCYSNIFFVVDEKLIDIHLNLLPIEGSIIPLPGGEAAKNIDALRGLWRELSQRSADRKSLLIIVGGGALSDLAAFAASTYMRGVEAVIVPTTLLAQIDASIGGKTAIDFAGIKNLVGTFFLPKMVVVDPSFLVTQPMREFRSGLAEMVKHAAIRDKKYFQDIVDRASILKDKVVITDQLEELIWRSIEIKGEIVKADPFEKGERKLLNLGHTVAHAIESLALDIEPILHGEAVALGMIIEAALSEEVGLSQATLKDKLTAACHCLSLPTSLPSSLKGKIKVEDIYQRMLLDKKNASSQLRFVLLKEIGEAVFDYQVERETVLKVISKYL